MKVLYSTQSVIEYDGEHYYNNTVKDTYPRYLALGNEITVLTHVKKVDNAQSEMIQDGALRYVFIKKMESLNVLLKNYRHTMRIIEEEVKNTDICVVHMNIHGPIVVRFANKYKKPVLSIVGTCTWDEYWNYDWKGKFLAPVAYLRMRNAQRSIPYSIYVTKYFLQKRYPTNGKWIACSNVKITTGEISALEKRKKTIEHYYREQRPLRIGTSAAIDVPYKGQKYVIQALGILKRKGLIFEYHLIGRGNSDSLEREACENGVQNQVFFHGALPHNEVVSFLDSIDVYVQPSKQEGLPRALIEAMSRGCLCMGSRIAGIPELLEERFMFKKGNAMQIARILESITKQDMEEQAFANFEIAKDYDVSILNERRSTFINQIKIDIENKK